MLSMKGHTNTDYMRAGGGQSVCTATAPDNNIIMRALARPTVQTSAQIMHALKLYHKVFLEIYVGS
jgi:hypothetical protein